MDLDIADTAAEASTSSAGAIQQQHIAQPHQAHLNEPEIASGTGASVLLFPFEAEGDSCAQAAAASC